MKAALLIVFSLIWSGSALASAAGTEPGYVNYDYPSLNTGVPFSILRTGKMVSGVVYEPGYVNYRYPSANREAKSALYGKWLGPGIFEPIYVNYCAR